MTDLIITNNEDNFQDIAEQKRLLRKQLRAMRRALTREEVETASSAAAQRVIALPEFQKAELILSYMSAKNELDAAKINEAARAMGKRVAFPLCIENGGLRLLVPRSPDAFNTGSYGILEPDPERSDEVTPGELGLIIVPAVAFDEGRRRLGQAVTVGVGYDFQLVESLPLEPHDKALDIVALPSALIREING